MVSHRWALAGCVAAIFLTGGACKRVQSAEQALEPTPKIVPMSTRDLRTLDRAAALALKPPAKDATSELALTVRGTNALVGAELAKRLGDDWTHRSTQWIGTGLTTDGVCVQMRGTTTTFSRTEDKAAGGATVDIRSTQGQAETTVLVKVAASSKVR